LFLFLLLIDRVVVVDYLRHHHSLVVGPVRIRLWWMDGWILLGVCMCIMLLLHSCTCFSCHMFHCLSGVSHSGEFWKSFLCVLPV
jgi:hypothetical protein